jgi:hypothetical protein
VYAKPGERVYIALKDQANTQSSRRLPSPWDDRFHRFPARHQPG